MDPHYEEITLTVEDRHWWYKGRRRIVNEVMAALPLPPGARILDAGCGSGRNLVEFAAFGEVTGLELSDRSLEVARARGVGTLVQGSIDAMPFDDGTFDLAASLDVIEHIEDDEQALAELRRVVRPGGFLLVTVPAYPSLWGPHDVANHHCRRYTRPGMLQAAATAGWAPVRTTHFNALLLPPAALYRFVSARLHRDREDDPGVSDLEQTPVFLDALLEQPMRAEAALIRSGRRIPAGLSLLVVFRAD